MPPLPSYDLAALAERLHRVDATATHDDAPHAAVAILLRETSHRGEAELFLIERAVREGDPWSGHMAFPGGRRDPRDHDLRHTAERETREEVGIDLGRDAALLARMPTVPALLRSRGIHLQVTPFVYALQRDVTPTPNHEVADTLWTPLAPLARGERADTFPFRFEGVDYQLPCHRLDARVVWGLTYEMMKALFEALHQG